LTIDYNFICTLHYKQFSFNIVDNNEDVHGPYFVDLASVKTSGDRLNALNNAIKNSANYYRIVVRKDNGEVLTNDSVLTELSEEITNYGFKILGKEIKVGLSSGNTIDDLVKAVNNELPNIGLNSVVFKFVNDESDSYFLLYSKTGEALSFSQGSLSNDNKPLFDNSIDENEITNSSYKEEKITYISNNDVGIKSAILKNNNNSIDNATFIYNNGTFVLENNSGSSYNIENTDYEFLYTAKNNVTEILKENSSEIVKYNVTEENKKIVITTDDVNKVPISSGEALISDNNKDYVGNLLDLFVERDGDIEYIEGKEAVPNETKDMIKVFSVEKGTSTKGIVFEVVKTKTLLAVLKQTTFM
jgi:hypothetical protein